MSVNCTIPLRFKNILKKIHLTTTIIKCCDEKNCDHTESFSAGPKLPGFLLPTADTLRHRIEGGWSRSSLAAAEKRVEDQTARWWLVSRSGVEKGYDAPRRIAAARLE